MQRSGSGWFETMLNSHINVSSNGEVFSVKERRNNVSMILKTLDQVYNLDWFNSASKNECSAAVGLKWMLNQAQVLASYKPKINATEIEPKLKQEEAIIAQALEFFNSTRHIVLHYEDLISNCTQKLQEIQEFLSVPHRNLTSRQVKIHGGPLANQVENWDELESILKKTSYERFLHADYR
uniref:Sulfotransferase n=1 Tax=Chenopodium quinoa TaxID=63459 RepID=A0A803M2J9_CHEQI